MDDIKGSIDTVSRLYQQLDEKISESGGLGNLSALHRKLREALGAVSSTDLVTLLGAIVRAKDALNALQDEIFEIHALKQAVESGAASSPSSQLREAGSTIG